METPPVSSSWETMRWRAAHLELLDQRALPTRLDYVVLGSAGEVAGAIRDMVVRGAPAIGCAAAYGVALEALLHVDGALADYDQAVRKAFQALAASRPTAVNLFWALARMERCFTKADVAPRLNAEALLNEARAIHEEDLRANLQLGEYGASLLPEEGCVLTHCNAGALATAGHGTALGVLRSARAHGKRLRVLADETRPLLQGARLTAWELRQDGFDVTLICDNMAGHCMQRGMVDAVIVGADRIAANGDVANKIGTFMVAVLARHHGIPFYVAAPCSTIDFDIADGSAIPIEQRASLEVTGFGEIQWSPSGVNTYNPAFDVTPASLVTAIITERGVVHQPDAGGLVKLRNSPEMP